MDHNWLELLQNQTQLASVLETNQYTEKFGLSLLKQDAELILANRLEVLKQQRRVEFGEGIVPKIIYEFCDSDYIEQDNYVDTILRLQDIFYLFKNEMQDEITDDELLHLMKEQFENLCYGDLDYLEGTCLSNFAQAIRAGYEGYRETDGYGVYSRFEFQESWRRDLYLDALQELFGR